MVVRKAVVMVVKLAVAMAVVRVEWSVAWSGIGAEFSLAVPWVAFCEDDDVDVNEN